MLSSSTQEDDSSGNGGGARQGWQPGPSHQISLVIIEMKMTVVIIRSGGFGWLRKNYGSDHCVSTPSSIILNCCVQLRLHQVQVQRGDGAAAIVSENHPF